MYYYGASNYSSKKEADGSITVTRTPAYDGVVIAFLAPVFLILFGLLGTAYNVVTLNFDAIAGLWSFVWWGVLIMLMVAPIICIVSFVLETFKKK